MAEALRRAGARRGRRGPRAASRARRSSAARYERPVRLLDRPRARRPHRCSPADFVTTDDGTGLVHIAPAFGEDDFAVAAERVRDRSRVVYNPVGARRHASTTGSPASRAASSRTPTHRHLIDDLDAARPALPRSRSTSTPTRTAGAAARRSSTTRKSSWYIRTTAGHATGCSPRTRRSAGTPSTSSTAASATGSRTTSTGRSRATATGARRCRSGSATATTATSASASARSPSCASARAARSPTTSTAPTSTRSSLALRDVRRRDAPRRVGDRHLVRHRLDAVRAVPLPVRERGASSSERFPADFICEAHRPDPRLVLHAARRVDPALRHAPATATASASG